MASKNGKSAFDLKNELLARGPEFSFFQALRLLMRLSENMPVHMRPDISLAFPASDIQEISELPGKKGFQLTATFLGLYGVSSPLPAFYSEDLISDAREESTATRDFIDIIHRRLFALLYDCWKKYRFSSQVSEERSPQHLAVFYALAGLSVMGSGEKDGTALYPFLRYAGLLGCHPRSALGLEILLSDCLGGSKVEIVPCMPRSVAISDEEKLSLGSEKNAIGVNSFIGEELIDTQNKFRVKIGPLQQEKFCSLLFGGDEHRHLTEAIRRYLVDPLEYDFELVLAHGEAKQTCLGKPEWSRLGLDTVLFTGELEGNLNVVFPSAN